MNFLLHKCPLAKEFITQKKGHSLGIADAKGMPFGGIVQPLTALRLAGFDRKQSEERKVACAYCLLNLK